MTTPGVDQRSPECRARDEQIAAEPPLPPLELPPEAVSSSLEAHLGRSRRRPLAVAGLVENGVIRLLDPAVKLPEHARVIVVAAEGTCRESGQDVRAEESRPPFCPRAFPCFRAC